MPELRRGRWAWHFDAGPLYLAVCRGRLTRFVEVRVGWRGRVWTSALGGGWPDVDKTDPLEAVGCDVVVRLFALRAGDRVGRALVQVLGAVKGATCFRAK